MLGGGGCTGRASWSRFTKSELVVDLEIDILIGHFVSVKPKGN